MGKTQLAIRLARDHKNDFTAITEEGKQAPPRGCEPVRPETPPPLIYPDGIKILHDCPDAAVDICFVHGLTGDRENTWTADGQSIPWPQALLPSKLDRARILTYGYDAYIVRKSVESSDRLIDHATNLLVDLALDRDLSKATSRPLIFVSHSLGGLVCKRAILLSRNNPEPHLQNIFDALKGVVFVGTPHKGAWMADWAKIPASALGFVKSSDVFLLDVLQRNNQLLESVQVDFLAMIRQLREEGRGLEVTCFFEELPILGAGMIVSKESATFEGYAARSIYANHRDMVKFSTAEDNGFKRILDDKSRIKNREAGILKDLDRWVLENGDYKRGYYDKGPRIQTLRGHSESLESLAWSTEGDRLASGSVNNTVRIWDPATGQCISTLDSQGTYNLEENINLAISIAWSPDGSRLASGSHNSNIKIWEPSTGRCLWTLKGHTSFVLSIAWSSDAKKLASGSDDNTIKIWELSTTAQRTLTLRGAQTLG
ncbi:alpha/beta-hydrolase [Penicillium cosmopolitanum]|uniref:Alpha/beta-hydrolase n=1 Tax=Penicillium cosmopolitanum TaxID=1131564 RepID=A0A9X0BBS3_9EURO|nr:alpha/beta-hydrolase [Penicillium cosmopolitanum]KAJ5403872.1 alpha/beta-hydrolase [Penicillium cosmopolitanum]